MRTHQVGPARRAVQAREVRAARAVAEIEELTERRAALVYPDSECAAERAAHLHQRALLAARLGAWWRVLARTSSGEVPRVFLRAARLTSYAEQDRARDTRERARFWAERATDRDDSRTTAPTARTHSAS